LLYRLGDYAAAVDKLNEVQSKAGDDQFVPAFLAMAHHQLGNADQAREWFGKSTAWVKAHPFERVGGACPLWQAHLLNEEAGSLLNVDSPQGDEKSSH
jgi:predicted transcriptional regulator